MATLDKLSQWKVFWDSNRLSKDVVPLCLRGNLVFIQSFYWIRLDFLRILFKKSILSNAFQMPVALRVVFILFPHCNIAAPTNFSFGEGPLTYNSS